MNYMWHLTIISSQLIQTCYVTVQYNTHIEHVIFSHCLGCLYGLRWHSKEEQVRSPVLYKSLTGHFCWCVPLPFQRDHLSTDSVFHHSKRPVISVTLGILQQDNVTRIQINWSYCHFLLGCKVCKYSCFQRFLKRLARYCTLRHCSLYISFGFKSTKGCISAPVLWVSYFYLLP